MAGQTINDRLLAARHSLSGQGLAKSVCKATTEEIIGPKKKHLDYLIHCTNEPNVSIPHLANLLIERSQNANWVVVLKSLITTHHLLAHGNERFMQYLASSNCSFKLENFLDKTGGPAGAAGGMGARMAYDMSPFIRRYSKYLNEKALSYRTVAFDFCKVKRGKEEGSLRAMSTDKLLKTLPVLQAQLDALLEFDCQANDLTNGVINMTFMLLFRDLIRLFACYNDGIINLLEKYFDMNKKQCRDALDLYKKFLVRMDRVGEFLKVAENVGIDKGDIPDLTKAPSSLLEALESHLANLEGRKPGSAGNTPTQSSASFGATVAKFDNTNGIDESIKAQALAEEEAAMNQYKVQKMSPGFGDAVNNPFLSSPPKSDAPIVNFFDNNAAAAPAPAAKPMDDLLQLGNPFADMFSGSANEPPANAFVSDNNFSTVFGNSNPTGFDVLGDVLKPTNDQFANPTNVFGLPQDPIADANAPPAQNTASSGKIITGDLDSSLMSLVDNLNINKTAPKAPQWNSPKNSTKPIANWTPQPMAATTGANYRPMAKGITVNPSLSTINHHFNHNSYPLMPGYMQQGQVNMMGAHTQSGVVQPMHPMQPMQNNVRLDPFGTS